MPRNPSFIHLSLPLAPGLQPWKDVYPHERSQQPRYQATMEVPYRPGAWISSPIFTQSYTTSEIMSDKPHQKRHLLLPFIFHFNGVRQVTIYLLPTLYFLWGLGEKHHHSTPTSCQRGQDYYWRINYCKSSPCCKILLFPLPLAL